MFIIILHCLCFSDFLKPSSIKLWMKCQTFQGLDMGYSNKCKSRSTVQFRSICHPYVTVTHLTKFSFRHLTRRAVTRSKFRQMAQILARIALFGTYVTGYPFVKQPCDVWRRPNFVSSWLCDTWQTNWSKLDSISRWFVGLLKLKWDIWNSGLEH